MAIVPSLPYTIQNGQPGDATQVMANLNAIVDGVNQKGAHNGANSDITSLSGMTTPLSVPQGGTGASSLTSGNLVKGGGSGPLVDSGIAAADVVTGPTTPTAGHVPKFAGSGTAIQDGYGVGTAANDLVQLNGSAQLPAVDGSQLTKLPTRLNANAFTSTGAFTFTTPANSTTNTLYKITLTAAGGGGGSGGPGGGGGGGETIIKWISGLNPNTACAGSVGSGGAAQTAGGNTTLTMGATTYTAHGGAGASASGGGVGGSGGNGDVNIPGGTGGDGNTTGSYAGPGGSSIWGAGYLAHPPTGATASTAGVGGNGGTNGGGSGGPGLAIVEYVL